MKFLIVVDMQNDFISGALGSKEAEAILARVVGLVQGFDGEIIFTRDTHGEDYMHTQEGQRLPVPHCIRGTDGWQIASALAPYAHKVVDKPTFGSTDLPALLEGYGEPVDEITLCGLCTDICVISNAMLLKAAFPEARIAVEAAACAGVTPESHEIALAAMRAVQIDIL